MKLYHGMKLTTFYEFKDTNIGTEHNLQDLLHI